MILLYHHVAPADRIPAAADRVRDEGWQFTHSPAAFEWQLKELRRRHYEFISLGQLLDEIRARNRERPGSVVVTFDDGWRDNYEFALPVLKGLGITATFFVTTAHLRPGGQDPKRMGLPELRHLVQAGFTIGAHSRSHPDLARISPEAAREEIAGSKADLESALGIAVDFFAYPGGAFNATVARLTQEAGYRAACSVLGPRTNDRRSLFWLFRDLLTPGMNTLGDRYRLSRFARRLFAFRVNRRLMKKLMS
ncbi:MAG TPA: polysaccharide deacetylase family protein [bacterium]|nr:polysaccharide deacetylase family protein [bacterium]